MSALLLTIAVENAAPGKAIGVKEAIAMDLEKYGDVRVLRVEVREAEQMRMKGDIDKGAPAGAQRSGSGGERRSPGMSELSPQAEAKDMEVTTTRAIKRIKAGLLHVEVIGQVPEREPGRRRSGRCRPTSSAQQFYNDKCSWRECELQLAANFGRRDLVLTLTYDDLHLPPDKRAADREIQKLIRRLRAARRRRGEELRYIYVTEGFHGKLEDEYFGGDGRLEDKRLHHHLVLNGAGPGDLEEIRSLWQGGGYVRAEPVDVHYYRELAKYLTKEAREFGRARPGERSWRASRNLKRYEVEYIEIPSDSVTLSQPPGAVDYVQFSEKNPYGFADCVGARYLLFEEEAPPEYSYTLGRKRKSKSSNNFST